MVAKWCLLTGSPLMYHDKFVGGFEVCAIHIRSAVSPTWYCFRGVSMLGPSCGKSEKDVKKCFFFHCDLKCDMAMFLKYWSYSFQFCEGMLFLSFSFSSWAFFGSLDFEPFLSYFDSLECPTEFLNQHTAISTRTHMERLQKKEEALDRCV